MLWISGSSGCLVLWLWLPGPLALVSGALALWLSGSLALRLSSSLALPFWLSGSLVLALTLWFSGSLVSGSCGSLALGYWLSGSLVSGALALRLSGSPALWRFSFLAFWLVWIPGSGSSSMALTLWLLLSGFGSMGLALGCWLYLSGSRSCGSLDIRLSRYLPVLWIHAGSETLAY